MTFSFSDRLILLIPGIAENLIAIAEQNNNIPDLALFTDVIALRNGIYTGIFLSVVGATQAAYSHNNNIFRTLTNAVVVTGSTVFMYNGLQLHHLITEYNNIQNDNAAQDIQD